MSTKNTLSWLLLFFGEAIIISAFILFRGETADDILTLNIVVSTIVYGMIFLSFRTPWINLKDKTQKQVGALGIRWYIIWLYAVCAIVTMIAANIALELVFTTQLIIHCTLLFFLFLGMLASRHSADKVKEVYEQQTAHRHGITEMKNAMRDLKDKMIGMSNLPDYFIQQINTTEENLRFLSPSNNQEAYGLEHSFVETINEIEFAISNYAMNEERITDNLKKLERTFQNRKSVYSQ